MYAVMMTLISVGKMIKYDDDNDNDDDNDENNDVDDDDDDNDDEIEEQYKFQPKRLRGRKSQKTIAGALLLGLWKVDFIIIIIIVLMIITSIMIMTIIIIIIISGQFYQNGVSQPITAVPQLQFSFLS